MSRIHIQFTLFSAFYSPLIVTMAGGFLQREGLDYEWSVSPPGKPATEAISDGSAQVVQSAPSQAFGAIARGEADYPLHFAQINEMDGFFISAREVPRVFAPARGDRVESLARRRLHDIGAAVIDRIGRRLALRRYRPGVFETLVFQKTAGHGQNQRRVKRRKQRELDINLGHDFPL